MKDLGDIHYILGLHVIQDRPYQMLYLSQVKYIWSILQKYGMEDCKSLATPLDADDKLSKDMFPLTNEDNNKMIEVPYQNAVDSLVYAMIGTRADIAFVIEISSQYMV